jgi:hypothetical protein
LNSFTTRVELHGADWDDYVKLHQEMAKYGFSRTITSDVGNAYQMPPAEYDYVGTASRSDVLAYAKAAASSVKSSYAVLVTEAVGRTWYGLEAA